MPGVGSLSIGKLGLLVSILLIALTLIGEKEVTTSRKAMLLITPFVLWFLYISLSSLWSPNQDGASRYVVLSGFNLLSLLIALKAGQNRSHAKALIFSIIAVSLGFALVDFSFDYRPHISRQYNFTNEVVGIFPNSISLGFTLASVLPGILLYIINKGAINIRLGVTAILSILVIFLTGSRSSLISSALSTIIMYSICRTQRRTRTILISSILLVVGFIFGEHIYSSILPAPIAAKISTIPQLLSNDGGFDATARGKAVQFGLEYFKSNPIIGYGSAAVEYMFQDIPELAVESNINAHNWWLENAINGGIISLTLFLLGYLNVLINIIIAFRKDFSLLNCILAGYIVAFPMLVFGPGSITNLPFPWILLGLAVARIVNESAEDTKHTHSVLRA
ncbi:O-antigen ligase family protein [Deinococcus aerius]|uniref:O-antigen ligase family protein n=1 Tax=Deinococcus aerius TaxID=200253 RepID=UPI0013FE1535|nr:O-antigen ligase family protein [Deinococcus aerius]